MRFLLSFLLFTVFTCAHGQNSQVRYIDSNVVKLKLDSLKEVFPLVENVPRAYELAIYSALEYYPELKDNKIRFKEKKIGTTLNARPTFASLFYKKRSKRVYVVRINNLFDKKEIITLDDVGFNAQVGVLGHEFNHFLDYSKRDFFQLLDRGVDYLTTRRKAKFEQEIDRETIERGLGWQCYEWSCYVHYESHATEEYLAFKREVYLGPEDILEIMGVGID
jgi:hypothetical protein